MLQATVNKQIQNIKKNFTNPISVFIRLTGFVFMLLVFSGISWSSYIIFSWLKSNNCSPLSKLIITGKRQYTTINDIRQAIMAIGVPGYFMTQNVKIIQQQINYIPWIKQVSVRKQWPDKLQIYLVEYVPIGYWNKQYLLDNSGVLFRLPPKYFINQVLPLFYGPNGYEQYMLSGYHIINSILTKANLKLKTISISTRYSWQLTLQDDSRIELGRGNITKYLQRFIKIYPVLLQQAIKKNKHINYIDMRYDSGIAVGWADKFMLNSKTN